MASHKSAAKKARQEIVRRARNRAGRSRLRTFLKNYRAMLAEGSQDCQAKLPEMYDLIDRSAKNGYIHRNAANRLKSNLAKQVNGLANNA